jgi:glycosyltransferase involved in cell wall biosynthesis
MPTPRVSIITVTYNAEQVLPATLEAVAALDWPALEHIVVDGQSTDRTLEIIRAAEGRPVTRWISERDAGIYDAMNKGQALATGDYLWFLNAGDTPTNPQTLRTAFAHTPQADLIYGDALIVDAQRRVLGHRSHKTLPKRLTIKDFRWGMVVCHQSMIVRRALSPAYSPALRYVADIDWAIRLLKQNPTVHRCPEPLCHYLAGGFSARHQRASFLERYQVLRNHYGTLPNLLTHFGILGSYAGKRLLGQPTR